MGRQKKHNQEIEENERIPVISGDIKRSIVAITLFVLAVLFILGFLSEAKIVDAGILGKFLNSAASWIFGVGKYVSPFVLIVAGIILLFRKETLFYVSKLLGVFTAFIGLLGLIHILSYDVDKLLQAAQDGTGGGFLGYIFAFIFLKLAGKIGGSVILIALLLIGIIVAFNFSIVKLIDKFIHKKSDENSEKENEEYIADEREEEPIPESKEEKEKKTEFVEEINNENEEEMRMKKILKKAAAWMPSGKNKKIISDQNIDWELPPIDLLDNTIEKAQGGDVDKNAKIIQDTLRNFGIEVELGEIKTGPTVTQYSFRPAVGVKLSRITALSNDLALRLAARQVRIEAPIPGRSLVGVEVPNKKTALIRLPELLQALEFETENQIYC